MGREKTEVMGLEEGDQDFMRVRRTEVHETVGGVECWVREKDNSCFGGKGIIVGLWNVDDVGEDRDGSG